MGIIIRVLGDGEGILLVLGMGRLLVVGNGKNISARG